MDLRAMLDTWLSYAALGLVIGWGVLALAYRLRQAQAQRNIRREGFVFLKPFSLDDANASPAPDDQGTP